MIASWDSKFLRKDITESKNRDIPGHSINVLQNDGFSTTNHQLLPNESSANESQRENKPRIKWWLCLDEHCLMDFGEFRSKSIDERKDFAKKEILCWNCMSKSHIAKDCTYKYNCGKEDYGKKHHWCMKTRKPT